MFAPTFESKADMKEPAQDTQWQKDQSEKTAANVSI